MGRRGRGGAIAGPPPLFSDPPPPLHPDHAWLCRCCFLPWGRSPAKVMGPTGETKHFFLGRGGGGGRHTL